MFNSPAWASQPSLIATVKVIQGDKVLEEVEIDRKPTYIFGSLPQCDFQVPSLLANEHAVLVHHADSRLFFIALDSEQATLVNGKPIAVNKPSHIKNNTVVSFKDCPHTFLITCETTGIKRRASQMAEKRTVCASHILIKHRESRRPSSWKEPVVTRSKETALEQIQELRKQISSAEGQGQNLHKVFGDVASRESHCSSAKREGDLGEFGPGQMQAPFEKATYGLQVGEMSQPVFTESGVHLILRTA